MVLQLAQQLAHRWHAYALDALRVFAVHQIRPVPRENYGDLLPDLQGTVGCDVQRDRGQGGIIRPLGDSMYSNCMAPSFRAFRYA